MSTPVKTSRVSSEAADLSTAASLMTVYAVLMGLCAFSMLVITLVTWSLDSFTMEMFGVCFVISLTLSILAWATYHKKPWVWLPAVAINVMFLTVFPIGTLVSYFALTALWRCRKEFYPFNQRKNDGAEKLS